jgi:hypothetical protein
MRANEQHEADPVIDEVREVRREISARVEHDPARLVDYYIRFQEQYRDRLFDGSRKATPQTESAA